jgi:DNA-binding NtrC family response regulator
MSMGRQVKIMVIDDEPEILISFQQIFEETGLYVFSTDRGKKAIQELQERKYDIAFIDMMMPEMDGITTMTELKKINPDLMAIMISGFRDEDKVEKALKLGAYGYLYKPLNFQDIIGVTLKCSQNLGYENDIEIVK